jgi:hypothetical protein
MAEKTIIKTLYNGSRVAVHPETEIAQIIDAATAMAHNKFVRGKDLTSYFNSGEMSTAIAAGTFKDIYPGDFITKSVTIAGTTYSDVKWLVGDLDYHLHSGDTETTAHHVLMVPEAPIGTSYMNSTNVTTGGYIGSYMWTTTTPKYVNGIKNAFGATHVLSHKELLTNSVSTSGASMAGAGYTGFANNWAWTSVDVNIMNEAMTYGTRAFSSSFYDIGDCNMQIALFRGCKQLSFSRSNWNWLRAVSYSTSFAFADGHGSSNSSGASHVGGVRPYFLLR